MDFNATILGSEDPDTFSGQENEEVNRAFASIRNNARHQLEELEEIIEAWKRARKPEPSIIRVTQNILSNRELIESWLEIKTTAIEMYRTAAKEAPEFTIRRRLERLADDDEAIVATLRELL